MQMIKISQFVGGLSKGLVIYKYSAILAIPPHHECQKYAPK